LLRSGRPEVFVSAAWGLRKLAVAETLPGVVRYVGEKQRQLRASAARPEPTRDLFDHQLSQLNQLLGQQRHAPADAVLRASSPRMDRPMQNLTCAQSRAAAVWALGLLHEGKAVPGLVAPLAERLADGSSLPPESLPVRCMAAVALGRMRAKEALPTLRRYCREQQPSLEPIHNGCGWAIERISGEAMKPPGTIREDEPESFFLAPAGGARRGQ